MLVGTVQAIVQLCAARIALPMHTLTSSKGILDLTSAHLLVRPPKPNVGLLLFAQPDPTFPYAYLPVPTY